MEGWIRLHRKIRHNPIFNNYELLRLWLICLTEASHKERDQLIERQYVKLQAGEFVTGRIALTEQFNHGLKSDDRKSDKTVWRMLIQLQTSNYLSIRSTNKFSVVTILNWDKYQNSVQQDVPQMGNKCPSNVQQVSTNNNITIKNNDNNFKDGTEAVPYETIIEYLNSKADKSYRHTSKASIKLIQGRWSEGYCLEDFFAVIDSKVDSWLNDPKMDRYLRPITLFAPGNFESYLNEKSNTKGDRSDAKSNSGSTANKHDDVRGNVAYSADLLDSLVRRQRE